MYSLGKPKDNLEKDINLPSESSRRDSCKTFSSVMSATICWGAQRNLGTASHAWWHRTWVLEEEEEFPGRGSGNSHSRQREQNVRRLEVGKNIGCLGEKKWFEVSRF